MKRRDVLAFLAQASLLAAGGAPRAFASMASQEAQDMAAKGFRLLGAGNAGEALAALREAARLDPSNPWIFNLLGRAAYQANQESRAAEAFRMALRLDPADGYASLMLEILAQRPLPPVAGQEKAPRNKKPSALEEQARKELAFFQETGKPPGHRLILLDPGHGGHDKGVHGVKGTLEKDLTLLLAVKVAALLNARPGLHVALTREADYAMPLWARSVTGALYGADLLASLHCGGALPGYAGVEVYSFAPDPSGPQAKAVADMENGAARFDNSVVPQRVSPGSTELVLMDSHRTRRVRALGRSAAQAAAQAFAAPKPLTAVHARVAPLAVLENAACPAILLEAGFLSNANEEAALMEGSFQDVLAAALAEALTAALG